MVGKQCCEWEFSIEKLQNSADPFLLSWENTPYVHSKNSLFALVNTTRFPKLKP